MSKKLLFNLNEENVQRDNLVAKYKFNSSLYDLIPIFNEGFEYTYEDENSNTSDIVTRTIYSKELPSLMRFGRAWAEGDDATNRELSLIEVLDMNTSNIDTMEGMFQHCNNLTKINCNWVTNKVTTMRDMFRRCYYLTELDTSNFDTSNVREMHAMFSSCLSLKTVDVSNFNVDNVTTMNCMFDGCYAITSLDVSSWNTSKVTDMYSLFRYCRALTSLDLSGWSVSKVTTINNMFHDCATLQTLNVQSWPLTSITQTAINSLPVGNDTKNEIYANVAFTVPSGWTIVNI